MVGKVIIGLWESVEVWDCGKSYYWIVGLWETWCGMTLQLLLQ